jgi:hypothetical protein
MCNQILSVLLSQAREDAETGTPALPSRPKLVTILPDRYLLSHFVLLLSQLVTMATTRKVWGRHPRQRKAVLASSSGGETTSKSSRE